MNERSEIMFRHMQWYCELQVLLSETKEPELLPAPHHWYDMTFAGYATETEVVIGIAVCSKNDNYNKEDGRDYASERAIHNPTFTFPRLHKGDKMAVHYYLQMLIARIKEAEDGRAVKNHVVRIQCEFDKTAKGIMLKQARQRKQAEKEQKQKAILKAKKLEKEKRGLEYKDKFLPTQEVEN